MRSWRVLGGWDWRAGAALLVVGSLTAPAHAMGPHLLGRLRMGEAFAILAGAGVELQTSQASLYVDGVGDVDRTGAKELTSFVGAEWMF